MGFSLKGFVTGIAGAAGDVMKEEQTQTNKIIAQRTKNSYENHMRYKEETEALRADIKKRDAELLSLDPTLTDDERVAAATIPNFNNMFTQLVASGRQIKVRDMLSVGKNTVGMKFDDWVSAVGKVAPATGAPAAVSTRFLGPSEEAQQRMAERSAASTGIPEAELRAFQTPPEKATVSSMGSLKLDVFKKAPKEATTVEEFAETARLTRMKAEAEKGKDSPEYKTADAAFKLATNNLDKPKETITARKDRLIQDKIDNPARAKDIDVELRKIYKELQIADRLSKDQTKEQKEETYAKLKRSTDDYVNTRMREMNGASWYKFTAFPSIPLSDGSIFVDRTTKEEMTPELQAEQFKVIRRLTKEALKSNGYLTETGAPVYKTVRDYMNNMNILGQDEPESATPVATPAATAARPVATPVATAEAPSTVVKVLTPSGTVMDFPNQAAADAYKKKAGIK